MVISSVATSPLIEMDAFMHIPRKFLAPIGIFTVVKNNRKQFVVKILFYLSFLNLGLCVLGEMIFFVLSFARNQGDFIQSTYLILCIGFILISFAKVIALISKLDTLHKLMDELSDIFPKTKAEQADYKVAECLQQTRWILKWYGVVQIFMIWSFSLVPQMSTITNYLQHGNWTVEFSYTIWYPIDPYQRGLFELFYVSQFWAAFCAAMGILSVDVVMCSIVMLICMNFDHLSNSFLNLKPSNSRRDIALLKDYVITHNKVINYAKELDGIFNFTNLFNFVSSSVVICVVGFLCIYSNQITEVLKFAFCLMTCTLQIYTVCWMGDRIIESSTGISHGVYNSLWYMGRSTYQRNLVMIIMRSQRQQTLTAYKFSYASRQSFASILSVSWKFLTLLNTMYSGH